MLALPKTLLAIAVAVAVVAVGCGDDGGMETATYSVDAPPAADSGAAEEAAGTPEKPKVTVPDGPPPKELKIEDLEEGSGPAAETGDSVEMHYVGVSYSNGKEFDNSYDRGQPFPVTLGEGGVIKGWDQGIVGMKVGGRRKLIIPPDLGYGAAGYPPDIKPNETLVFVVDLVGRQ
jgi:FKBP-type peptidyl-prolyl cis-trans isomerase